MGFNYKMARGVKIKRGSLQEDFLSLLMTVC